MGHYKANLRDIEFNVFEALQLGPILDSGAAGELDSTTARESLAEVARFAEGPIAESFAAADRTPPVFLPDRHTITVPEPIQATVQAIWDAEWWRLRIAPEIGGVPVPAALMWAFVEMVTCANPALTWYYAGPAMADILYGLGNERQRALAKAAVERRWGATMVLTEPDAGSDVGAGRTKAIEQPDGSWHIEGVKRFISGGDLGDTVENIFHLVLARPVGAKPGTKGLSLFVVPNFLFDWDTFQIGDRNGVFATGLEHKMGYKASPTCELTFGAHGIPAKGWLVGDKHDGIAQMFKVIEIARMLVGIKSSGTLSTGYLNALEYAKTRIQGADMTQMLDKSAPRVPITRHPDVRRSLILQKAYAEGLRAVYLYTAAHQDAVVAKAVSGADEQMAARVNDLLLPIVKGVGSERAYQYLTESLQTLGGSGFLQDYPIEQYIRDAKIDSVYEGTTAMQALDFFFRKIAHDEGVALAHVAGQIQSFLDSDGADQRLKEERAYLCTALEDVQAITGTLTGYLIGAAETPTELYKVGLGSVRYLLAVGDLLIGWQLVHHAEIALRTLDSGSAAKDNAFYEGKVAAAQFFAANVLPEITAVRGILARTTTALMNLDDDAF
ncbi:MAG TPA: acyl-CoA dehydrogenase [Mycobacterium sp.]|nr:acyl-CoA dehydrogenase [Mycobacterium sp.]